jgi:hypothetical protein
MQALSSPRICLNNGVAGSDPFNCVDMLAVDRYQDGA